MSKETLLTVVLSTSPDTRTRQKACIYTKVLAKFAGIDFDPSEYSGNYSPESVELRDIPSDKQIMQWRDRITNKQWQFAFELMAAYGLRNHEVFHCDISSLRSTRHLRITTPQRGKKKERFIWCLYPEWYEMWNLGGEKQLPISSGKTNSDKGDRVNKAFKRYGFIKPYNLRHAWAIRSIGFIPKAAFE